MSQLIKNLPANTGDARDAHSIPESERFPGGENGNLLWYSCLENSMDRGQLYSPWGHKGLDPPTHTHIKKCFYYMSFRISSWFFKDNLNNLFYH